MASERILIIANDPDSIEFLLTTVVAPHGYLAQTATNGQAGIKAVQKESPDIVLLDLGLNDMTTTETFQQLQALGAPPVIMMTSPGAEAEALQAFRWGARDALIKPFTAQEMARAITRVLYQQRLTRERDQLVRKLAAANEELEYSLNRIQTLLNAGKTISSSLDLQKVLTAVVQVSVSITQAQEGYLFLRDARPARRDELYLRAAQNLGKERATILRMQANDSIAGHVARTGEPLVLSSEGDAPIKIKTGYLVRSLVNVPLQHQGQVLGVLGVDNVESDKKFSREDVELLSTLGEFAATAIHNAQLYTRADQALDRHQRETHALQAVGTVRADATDARCITQQALTHAIQATDAVAGLVGLNVNGFQDKQLPNAPTSDLETHIDWIYHQESPSHPAPQLKEVIQLALSSGKTQRTQGHALHSSLSSDTLYNYLAVPLRQENKTIGAIGLQLQSDALSGHGYPTTTLTQKDLCFLGKLADCVAERLNYVYRSAQVEAERRKADLVRRTISEGVCTVDPNLRITSVNPALEHLTGLGESELIGRSYGEVFTSQIQGQNLNPEQTLPEQALLKASTLSNQGSILHQDGRCIPIVSTAAPLRNADGSIGGALVIIRTLTAEVRLNQLRRKFMDMVAYLKTRATPKDCYAVTLKPVIARAVDRFQNTAPGYSFEMILPQDLPFVLGDEKRIELDLVNLLDNALALGDQQKPIVIRASVRDDCVAITIKDTKEFQLSLPKIEIKDTERILMDR